MNQNKLYQSNEIEFNNDLEIENKNNQRQSFQQDKNNRILINDNNKNINMNSPDVLVKTLKYAINDTNKQYKLLRKEFIDEVKKKSEAQQLLQKCIEDLKLEISLTTKDIQNFSTVLF